jgi:endogenous inhibitor of DNA gyrase (YacG/DUF329 family)
MPPESGTLCVQCRRAPAVPEWRPFCSERCRLLDLARWVDGRYRIAGEPESPVPDEPSSTEP